MDPLSVTASIIAILKLTHEVTRYLSDVADAPKECEQCIIEVSNLIGPLTSLEYCAKQANTDDPWYEQLRRLNVKDGPLEQYEQALRLLQSRTQIRNDAHRMISRLTWTFKKDEIARILATMERLKSLVSVALEMDHFKLSQAIKEGLAILQGSLVPLQNSIDTIEAGVGTLQLETHSVKDDTASIRDIQDIQQHQNLLQWLSPTDFPARQHQEISRKQEGTAQWFLDSIEFNKWISGTDKTLFCPGIPGAGKTMMTAVAVDHLRRVTLHRDVAIAYLFCSYKAQFTQTASDLFGALLKQLVQSRPDIAGSLKELHDRYRGGKASSEDIYRALQSGCSAYKTVYLLVDALDEFNEKGSYPTHFIDMLLQLQSSADVRILLTSRFIPTITERLALTLTLEVRASEEDVRRFVQGQLLFLPKCVQHDQDLQNTIVSTITEAAQGMFLLARLHVESLSTKRNRSKVLATLNKLSRPSNGSGEAQTLDEAYSKAYDEAIERIESQPADDRLLAKQALCWIIYAQRLLTTDELSCALAIEPGDKTLNRDNVYHFEDITSVCAGLITVDKSTNIVRFVHYTTQQYFERVRLEWNPTAQRDIAVACLTYLCFDAFKSGSCDSMEAFQGRVAEHKFFDYSARFWARHFHPVQDTRVSELAWAFLHNEALVESAVQLEQQTHYAIATEVSLTETSALHHVAQLGLEAFASLLIEDRLVKSTIDMKDNRGKTPLFLAAEEGHDTIVKILLDSGQADVDPKDRLNTTPLSRAVLNGHEAVVKLLLEKGRSNVNMVDFLSRTPLFHAARDGNNGMVRLLLETGKVEVDLPNNFGETPLSVAAEEGHEAVVRLLLETGKAEVEFPNDEGETPLSKAAEEGHEAVVRLLIEKGKVGVEFPNGYGETPLHIAAQNGREAVLRVLLESGKANVNLKTDQGRTPLSIAAWRGHEAIVKLLLDTDRVDIDLTDHYGATPLAVAAHCGNEEIVQLLLETGQAEIDSRDNLGMTPLSRAMLEGHEGVVNLLLIWGAVVGLEDITN